MNGIDAAHLREQVLIWAAALALSFCGLRLAQRALPGPFSDARAQLKVESRNLGWVAADLRAGRLTVLTGPSGLSVSALRRKLDDEDARLASRVAGHAVVRREDLLETASRGLR